MTPLTILLVILALAALALTYQRHRASQAAARPVARPRAPLVRESAPARREAITTSTPTPAPAAVERPIPAPKLDALDWDKPLAVRETPVVNASDPVASARDAQDALCRRNRDRYIAARFPCAAQSSEDLDNIERVIKASRLMFEEDKADRAIEFLALAVQRNPDDESLGLAQLEIAFLMRDGATYRALASAFRQRHPASTTWSEIARLGRAIAPRDALFSVVAGARAHAHYGPWPDMPNWIQASWDLTSEVLASDFHRGMRERALAAAAAPIRHAA